METDSISLNDKGTYGDIEDITPTSKEALWLMKLE